MTNKEFDARMDKLTEKQEAITQSVELMAGLMVNMMEGIDRLSKIVESHEKRLEDLEG